MAMRRRPRSGGWRPPGPIVGPSLRSWSAARSDRSSLVSTQAWTSFYSNRLLAMSSWRVWISTWARRRSRIGARTGRRETYRGGAHQAHMTQGVALVDVVLAFNNLNKVAEISMIWLLTQLQP